MADLVDALNTNPVPHLNETLRKSKGYYSFGETLISGKNTCFSEKILGHFCAKKLCIQIPHGINQPVPLKDNYRSQELRWLTRVGMFFAKRVLLVQARVPTQFSKSIS